MAVHTHRYGTHGAHINDLFRLYAMIVGGVLLLIIGIMLVRSFSGPASKAPAEGKPPRTVEDVFPNLWRVEDIERSAAPTVYQPIDAEGIITILFDAQTGISET